MAAIGVTEFLEKKFIELDFEGEWLNSFGKPEKNFKCLVAGASGNGKTEFVVKLAKYITNFTKVYYNSHEQKFSKSLQDALVRNQMWEVKGRIIFADGESFEEMKSRLAKRNSPGCCIIDSRDYMKLTEAQFKELVELFPHKMIIVICWADGSKPKGNDAKAIEYMCDVKILVKNFRAHMRSRFGGNEDFIIWDKKAGTKPKQEAAQPDLFNAPESAEIPTINS